MGEQSDYDRENRAERADYRLSECCENCKHYEWITQPLRGMGFVKKCKVLQIYVDRTAVCNNFERSNIWQEKDQQTQEAQTSKEEGKDTTSSKIGEPPLFHIKDPEKRGLIREFLIACRNGTIKKMVEGPRISEDQIRNARQLDKWVADAEAMMDSDDTFFDI